jgi:transposase
MIMYFLGIDVAKRFHAGIILDQSGQAIQPPFTFSNTQEGMARLFHLLAPLKEPVTAGLEASGHYWLALYDQLTQAGYAVVVLNPLQIHAYRRTGIRKRKTDKHDAFWIADFLRISGTSPSQLPVHIHLQLRQLARFRLSLTDQIGEAKRRIIGLMDRVFPEYESLFSDIFLASSRRLLQEGVTSQDFATLDLSEMTRLLLSSSRGRFGEPKAKQIIATAQRSIGVTFLANAARLEVGCLLAQIDFLEIQVQQVDAALDKLLAQTNQYLTTIPGIGTVTAAAILGEIGDISRFPSLEKLVAYTGIDPAVYQTGEFEATQTHISKRGSRYLRRAIWLAATVARNCDPELSHYYQRKRAEGKPHGTVIGAICRRLLARVYVVLRENRPYVVRQSLHTRLDSI